VLVEGYGCMFMETVSPAVFLLLECSVFSTCMLVVIADSFLEHEDAKREMTRTARRRDIGFKLTLIC